VAADSDKDEAWRYAEKAMSWAGWGSRSASGCLSSWSPAQSPCWKWRASF